MKCLISLSEEGQYILPKKNLPSSWSPKTPIKRPKGSFNTWSTLKHPLSLMTIPVPTALVPNSVKNSWLLSKILLHFFNSCSDPSDLVSCNKSMSKSPFSNADFIFLIFIWFLFACPCMLNDPILRLRLEYCEPGLNAWLFGRMIIKWNKMNMKWYELKQIWVNWWLAEVD